MSEELRPCPFCGVNEWKYQSHFSGTTIYQCEKCGTIVEEWVINTRPIEDALNARIAELEYHLDDWTNNGWAEDYKSRIAELEGERMWIPVSERLPEIDDGDIKDYDVVYRGTVIVAKCGWDDFDKKTQKRLVLS